MTLDAGIAATPLEVGGLHERVLCHEAFYVYLPDGHTLLSQARIRQSDLVDEHVWLLSEGHCFRTQVLHLCSVDRRRPTDGGFRVRFDGGSFETLAAIVDSGVGITVLPELTVRQLAPARQAARVRPFASPSPSARSAWSMRASRPGSSSPMPSSRRSGRPFRRTWSAASLAAPRS